MEPVRKRKTGALIPEPSGNNPDDTQRGQQVVSMTQRHMISANANAMLAAAV